MFISSGTFVGSGAGYVMAEVYENQRWDKQTATWGRQFLVPGVHNPPFSDKSGKAHVDSFLSMHPLPGYIWVGNWFVTKLRGKTDMEGFEYGDYQQYHEQGEIFQYKLIKYT